MTIEIGTAPDAWGVWFPDDPRQIPWPRFLDEVAEVGYKWIELGPYGYLPTNQTTLKAELDQRGLRVCACLVEGNLEEPEAWPCLEAQLLGSGELVAELGGRYMVLIDEGYFDLITGAKRGTTRLEPDAWSRLVETTHRVAKMARDRFGLELIFHPNAETHVEHEDQIEALLEQTDPNLVGLCLDIGHHAYCDGDPITFIRRHHRRLSHLHFKNVDAAVLMRVRDETLPMGDAVASGVFCELGKGLVDYTGVRDVLQDVGYSGWAMVEQDMYPADFDFPLSNAQRSRSYLHSIGFE